MPVEFARTEGPLVSVLLPVRNAGRYLETALMSLLQQSWRNLEVLVVDDHSTDGAIQGLALHDPRISVLENSGCGIVAALNTAARHARGSFLARMDADDIALPRRIEEQVELLLSCPDIGIAGTKVRIFCEHCDIGEGYRAYESWINALVSPEQIAREIFVESPIPHPSAMFRREVFFSLGGYRETAWAEDYDFWLRAHARGLKMAKPEEVLLYWRDHDRRLSRNSRRYSNDRFLQAKAKYLSRGVLRNRNAVIWGAGPTGRKLFDSLSDQGSSIDGFIDVHPRRIGGRKRGRPVWPSEQVLSIDEQMVLVAVGARGARAEIREFMNRVGKCEGRDYLFVA